MFTDFFFFHSVTEKYLTVFGQWGFITANWHQTQEKYCSARFVREAIIYLASSGLVYTNISWEKESLDGYLGGGGGGDRDTDIKKI